MTASLTTDVHAIDEVDFVLGLLVSLSARGVTTLRLDPADTSLRFAAALAAAAAAGDPLASIPGRCFADVVSGVYAAFEDGVHQALAFGFAEYPDHNYRRLTLTLAPRAREQILARWGVHRAALDRCATAWLEADH